MPRIICESCGAKLSVDKFVKGKTPCPRCGFSAFLKLDKDQVISKSSFVEKKATGKMICSSCGISWQPSEGIDIECPKCSRREGLHLEVVEA